MTLTHAAYARVWSQHNLSFGNLHQAVCDHSASVQSVFPISSYHTTQCRSMKWLYGHLIRRPGFVWLAAFSYQLVSFQCTLLFGCVRVTQRSRHNDFLLYRINLMPGRHPLSNVTLCGGQSGTEKNDQNNILNKCRGEQVSQFRTAET